MQDRREYKGFRVFAVISDRKVIRVVKVLREMWVLRDRQDRWDR